VAKPLPKVLIVEDARTVTQLIQVYLQGWDLDFHEAKNGEDGRKKAIEINPQLIITDVSMPGMDGFELCAAIRSDPKLFQVPILMITALKDEAVRQKGRLLGVNAFLHKPVSVNDLREQVKALLELS
jgi:twitching motility two-component system response regulator PilG